MEWSPEQIARRLRLEKSEHSVGVETIYRFIYRPRLMSEKLYRFLRPAKASRGREPVNPPSDETVTGRHYIAASNPPSSIALIASTKHMKPQHPIPFARA